MTHEEFVKAYKAGEIKASVNLNNAITLLRHSSVPRETQIVYAIWTMIWLLTFPAAIICFIWVKWWVALIIFLVGLSLPNAMRNSACKDVLEQALEDESFYNIAIESGGFVIKEKAREAIINKDDRG